MAKTLCVNISLCDADTLGAIKVELCKIPCLFKFDFKNKELSVTAQERYMVAIEKVVARYV